MTVLKPRVPQQARSKQRVQTILNAMAHLLCERDYAAITVTDIAERAETSVGSLYQFFPNKDAVLQSLAEGYLDEMRAQMPLVFAACREDQSTMHCVTEAFARFTIEHPGLMTILKSQWVSPEIRTAIETMFEAMGSYFAAVIADNAPHLSQIELRAATETILGIVAGVLAIVEKTSDELREPVIVQMQTAMTAYFEALIKTQSP